MTKKQIKQFLFRQQGGRCCYCLVEMRFGAPTEHPLHPELEHVVAKANGGKNILSNYSLACRGCNGGKGSKSVREFIRFRNEKSGELILRKA